LFFCSLNQQYKRGKYYMKIIRMFTTLLAGALILFSAGAFSVPVELVGISDSVPYKGDYAGFYELNIDGTTTLAMCDDVLTSMSIGDTWTGVWYTKSDVDAGANVKFSGADQSVRYSQAGWLFSQAASVLPQERARIHAAVWNIMTPGGIAMDATAQGYYDSATSGLYDAFAWENVMRILTPNPFDTAQEMFVAAVPIPAAVYLFGSGILGMTLVARRKKE
jgi:hypothetical protein